MMYRVLLFTVICAGITAADFIDDFESYTPGDLLETSTDWDRAPVGGYVEVVEQTGGNAGQAMFPDSAYVGYICNAPGFWSDGSVAMDFCPEGSDSYSVVCARIDILNGAAYVAGITKSFGYFTFVFVAYMNVAGEYELLYTDVGPVLQPGEWVNVRLHVEGTDPVCLTLYIDGVEETKVFDSTHLLGEGICGFALSYEGDLPTLLVDNFEVILEPQAMSATTFGALKAMFR